MCVQLYRYAIRWHAAVRVFSYPALTEAQTQARRMRNPSVEHGPLTQLPVPLYYSRSHTVRAWQRVLYLLPWALVQRKEKWVRFDTGRLRWCHYSTCRLCLGSRCQWCHRSRWQRCHRKRRLVYHSKRCLLYPRSNGHWCHRCGEVGATGGGGSSASRARWRMNWAGQYLIFF